MESRERERRIGRPHVSVWPVAVGTAAVVVLALMWAGVDGQSPASVADQQEATFDLAAASPPFTTLNTVVARLRAIGGREDLSAFIGQHLETVLDLGRNDVAAWAGTPPDTLLIVLDRDTRTAVDRMLGRPAAHDLSPPPRGLVTVRGVIEPLPYAEAMYSWNLTRRDVSVLAERQAYLRVYEVVSRYPGIAPPLAAEEVDEWNRETAPPPGEQVETPLQLPPPKP